MRRLATWSFLLALVALLPAIARASAVVVVGNAPPPPVVAFRAEPRMVIVPGTTVYVVHNYEVLDYDYFEYGAWYYIYSHDHWYKAPGYRGPFVVVHEVDVPRVFYALHDRGYHWKNRPYGLAVARTSGAHHPTTVHHAMTPRSSTKVVAMEKHPKHAPAKAAPWSQQAHKVDQHAEKHGEKHGEKHADKHAEKHGEKHADKHAVEKKETGSRRD
jgi:hypothetical protein